ncbi:MAG: tetratricopeptide repeat protein [Candidatus Omnitrophica bacterium]|nr:tetratricopeptide repeat protein [Candidatus Omnitrophota bacterium]MBU1995767.1 tetratricopeptide repeat protein [Candidatus Omnitrophota bacterium]MBU4333317.1 tetratricopeptide repeat protein [Candidatus Omnitrophota bacterium]
MKRLLLGLAVIVLLVGCGSKPEQKVQKPNSKEYIDAGMNALKEGEIVNAIKNFDTAIKVDPRNPENYIVLGQVYLRLKNYQAAIDTLSAATKVAPNSGEAYYFLATSRMMRQNPGDKEQAIEDAKMSAEIFLRNNDQERLKKAIVLVQSFSQVQ